MIVNICRHCGKMFRAFTKKTCCKECIHFEEEEFKQIEDYLKKYPNSNAIQIAEGLGMSPFDILKFIDEGRLSIIKGEFKSEE